MNSVGHWIEILCFKHDGKVHREWDRGFIVDETDEYFIVVSNKAKVVESSGRKWFTGEPAVTVFSKVDWFNVICMLKPNGISYYCNIASPTILENWVLKYIDYDLDVKVFQTGKQKVLDEGEYQQHRKLYGYSDKLDEVLRYELDKVLKMSSDKVFPFNDQEILAIVDKYNKMKEDKGKNGN